MPHDLAIGDVYIPPLLASAITALAMAALTTHLLRARGVMAHFANPALVFLSITVIFTVLLGSTLFPT